MVEMNRKKISVVIPCYNEEKSIDIMYNRLIDVFSERLPRYNFEIIYVDDFSTDNTRDRIELLCEKDKRVKAVFNARNFGFHRNVFSSLSYGSGDAVFLLFGDLQDPPEMLPEFVEKWEKGKKVVVGQRSKSDEGIVMTFMRFLYYKIIKWFSDTQQIDLFTGFGLYDKEFTDVLPEIDDIQPYFKAIVAEYGMDIEIVKYEQSKSERGKSNFNFWRNYDFAMQGITSSTKLLMRLATFVAVIIALICIGISVFVFINKLLHWETYPAGTASLIIGIFFLGAIQLFFVGILGEYILSINSRIVKKPRVVIGKTINFEEIVKNNEEVNRTDV